MSYTCGGPQGQTTARAETCVKYRNVLQIHEYAPNTELHRRYRNALQIQKRASNTDQHNRCSPTTTSRFSHVLSSATHVCCMSLRRKLSTPPRGLENSCHADWNSPGLFFFSCICTTFVYLKRLSLSATHLPLLAASCTKSACMTNICRERSQIKGPKSSNPIKWNRKYTCMYIVLESH